MWKRLNESNLRNTGGSGEFDVVRRCYKACRQRTATAAGGERSEGLPCG